MSTDSKRPIPWLRIAFLLGITVTLWWLAQPSHGHVHEKTHYQKATSNCRQIVSAMKLWAEDHDGAFPDGATANAAFRQLIQDDVIQDERIFGCPTSPYNGDNNLGEPPEFHEAVAVNENHWMMIAGVTEKSPDLTPVVFENALSTILPLTWGPERKGLQVRGSTWTGGKIVIGFKDGSVALVDITRPDHPLAHLPPGTRVLDIETTP
ncbi:MAG: hypothetical protein H7A55_03125 [Verrucomicrobiaceae bacterium]|nr:hypothetical protein [Verrucomicrobiaceae bacterium]